MVTLGNAFDTINKFVSLQPRFPPKPLDIIPPEGGCSEGSFNDWGGRGYDDDSVPGEVTKTAPFGDRTT